MFQKRSAARRADTGNVIERIVLDSPAARGAVARYRKAVRLIAQALQIVEDRVIGRQAEGRLAGHIEILPARIPVRPLGDGRERNIAHAEFLHHRHGCGELALAAIDQHQTGHRRALLAFLGEPCDAAAQHGRHHREIVVRGGISTLHVEAPVLAFSNPSGPATIIAPSALEP